MKAIFNKGVFENAKNYGGDKELVNAYSVVGLDSNGKLTEFVCARAYMGRSRNSSVVYASLWLHGNGRIGEYRSGKGSSGGYGYHKESAAFNEAIRSAGIQLMGDQYAYDGMSLGENGTRGPEDLTKTASISGVGESAMESAFLAIAKAMGAQGELIIVRH